MHVQIYIETKNPAFHPQLTQKYRITRTLTVHRSFLNFTTAKSESCSVRRNVENEFLSATWYWKSRLEQKCKPEKRLPWWSTSYHRWLKSPVGEILPWRRAELEPLPTPNKSQGTSKIFSKIFSYDPGLNLFYGIFGLLRRNQSLFSDPGLLMVLNSHFSEMSAWITK